MTIQHDVRVYSTKDLLSARMRKAIHALRKVDEGYEPEFRRSHTNVVVLSRKNNPRTISFNLTTNGVRLFENFVQSVISGARRPKMK